MGVTSRFAVVSATFALAACMPSSRGLEPKAKLTVDARISGGARFDAYTDLQSKLPVSLPVVAGVWHEYTFELPRNIASVRLDPTEVSGATAEIRMIRIAEPGQQPRRMPVERLPEWIKTNAEVTYDPGSRTAEVRASAPEMYLMSAVGPATSKAE